jgi:hypothetical protein
MATADLQEAQRATNRQVCHLHLCQDTRPQFQLDREPRDDG